MRLLLRIVLVFAASCAALAPLSAQPARDSAFVAAARKDLDAIGQAQARLTARIDSLLRPTIVAESPKPIPIPDSPIPVPSDTARFAGAAELPRVQVDTRMPTITRTVRIAAGADLQKALSAAQPGDELVLAQGATYVANLTLTAKANCKGIVVRADSIPVTLGSRMRPSLAGRVAKIVSPNTLPAIATGKNACGWRLVGLNITHAAMGDAEFYNVVVLGEPDAGGLPSDIVLDRVWIHGASATSNTRRGVAMNGARLAVIDSWISDIQAIGSDSQGIGGWDGTGPYLIQNNRIEGAGENIIFGGADTALEGVVPSDITIVGNHIIKPLTLKGSNKQAKNLLELKNAKRVLIDRNVFDGAWKAAQDGYAFILGTHNQGGGRGAWTEVSDVTIRRFEIRNADGGFAMTPDYDGTAVKSARFTITDGNLGDVRGPEAGKLVLMNGSMANMTFARLTGTAAGAAFDFGGASTSGSFAGLSVRDCRMAGAYHFKTTFADALDVVVKTLGIPAGAISGNRFARPADRESLYSASRLPGNLFANTLGELSGGGVDQTELARSLTGVIVAP